MLISRDLKTCLINQSILDTCAVSYKYEHIFDNL